MRLWCITALVIASLGFVAHIFHISKCDVNYDTASERFQFAVHIFIDDIELALENEGAPYLHIGTKLEKPQADSLLQGYLNRHLQLQVGDKNIPLNYLGKETSDDLSAIYCYLESEKTNIDASIILKNDVLMETYSDQQNIIRLTIDKEQKGYELLTPSKPVFKLLQ